MSMAAQLPDFLLNYSAIPAQYQQNNWPGPLYLATWTSTQLQRHQEDYHTAADRQLFRRGIGPLACTTENSSSNYDNHQVSCKTSSNFLGSIQRMGRDFLDQSKEARKGHDAFRDHKIWFSRPRTKDISLVNKANLKGITYQPFRIQGEYPSTGGWGTGPWWMPDQLEYQWWGNLNRQSVAMAARPIVPDESVCAPTNFPQLCVGCGLLLTLRQSRSSWFGRCRSSGISWEVAGIFIFSIIAILGVATLRVAIPKCMVPILAQDVCWDAEVMRTKEHGQDLNSLHFESTRQNKVYLYMCYVTQFHEKIIERQDNLNHEVYPTYKDGCRCRWWVLHQQKAK